MLKYKRLVAAIGLLAVSIAAVADGYYSDIPYRRDSRQSDPFVFCHYGLQNTEVANTPPCWNPTKPYTGGSNYKVDEPRCCSEDKPICCIRPYCNDKLNWTPAEIDALTATAAGKPQPYSYKILCSQAGNNGGDWHLMNGDSTGEQTPTKH
jgi:hypothetical protein